MFKKLLGIAPTPTRDGAFSPSKLALKLATSDTTDYDGTVYPNAYTGGKLKVLMVCTEERNLTMKNGKKFSTGNHPIETFVPMLHFNNAGFDIDIITPSGKPVELEHWAMPEEDKNVQAIYEKYRLKLENPLNLENFAEDSLNENSNYVAVFIPGGHGAMIGLPENQNLNKLIHWAHKNDLFMLSICHGPAAFLSANLNNAKGDFIYKGYDMAVFPDSVDKQVPMIGYMPGHVPWKFGEKLKALGVNIVNKKADDTFHIDRKLITGASPDAANGFGKLAANELLKAVNK